MNYTLEIELNQPRARVVELFDDADNLGAWQPGYLGMKHVGGEEGKAGAQYELRYLHGKREIPMLETIEVHNLPDEFSAVYDAKGMKMKVTNKFEEVGEGKTRMIVESEAEVSGILMKLIALIMPGCFKKQSWKYMENFKAFVEEGKDLRKEK